MAAGAPRFRPLTYGRSHPGDPTSFKTDLPYPPPYIGFSTDTLSQSLTISESSSRTTAYRRSSRRYSLRRMNGSTFRATCRSGRTPPTSPDIVRLFSGPHDRWAGDAEFGCPFTRLSFATGRRAVSGEPGLIAETFMIESRLGPLALRRKPARHDYVVRPHHVGSRRAVLPHPGGLGRPRRCLRVHQAPLAPARKGPDRVYRQSQEFHSAA